MFPVRNRLPTIVGDYSERETALIGLCGCTSSCLIVPPKTTHSALAESDTDGIAVDRLYRELVADSGGANGPEQDPGQRSSELLEAVTERLLGDQEFTFDESVVKASLDDILLVLVALRDTDTHGKGIMEDVEAVFDADLSPGTVYPRLHKLEDEGLLRVQELVRTKEYRVDDREAVLNHIEKTMQQHLVLGALLYAARNEL